MRKTYDVIVAGHICFDVTPDMTNMGRDFAKALIPGNLLNVGPATVSTGGAVSNTGLALLKLGIKTGLMGKVGTDFFGRAILEYLRTFGIKSGMRVIKGEHSSYTLVIAPPGVDRIFLHCPGANDTFTIEDIDFDLVARAKVFHFGYPPAMRAVYAHDGAEMRRIFEKAKAAGAVTSLDMTMPDPGSDAGRVNWDRALKRILPFVDLFLPSAEESLFMLRPDLFARRRREAGNDAMVDYIRAQDLSEVADKMLAYGARIVMLKCGHRGLYLRTANARSLQAIAPALADLRNWADRELWEPSYHVERVLSATGSGDSAIAGFLAAFVRQRPAEECLKFACAVGSFNVTAYDSVSGVRSWEETARAIRRGWKKNPLNLDGKNWRFDCQRATWISCRDAVLGAHGCAR